MWFKLVLFVSLFAIISSFDFYIEPQGQKCFHEEIPANFDVWGKYELDAPIDQTTDLRIVEVKTGKDVYNKDDLHSGEFTFTAHEGGDYSFCFFSRNTVSYSSHIQARRVSFKVLTGSETVNYQNIARKEHLKPIELNLRMMEDSLKSIYLEYVYFKDREHKMRQVSDSTSSRIKWLGAFSIIVIIASSIFQALYMKSFFRKKKLI
eukprot:gene9950-2271_t